MFPVLLQGLSLGGRASGAGGYSRGLSKAGIFLPRPQPIRAAFDIPVCSKVAVL